MAIMTGLLETLDCNSKVGQDPEPRYVAQALLSSAAGAHVISE
jgi:hypothetical protein